MVKMKFIDASVFLYAYLKPRKDLPPELSRLKAKAKEIISRIEKGEPVMISVVHLSEIANIIESRASLSKSIEIIESIIMLNNVRIKDVSLNDYLSAIKIAREKSVGINDALAYYLMKKHGISEIYSFDKHFDNFKDIKRKN